MAISFVNKTNDFSVTSGTSFTTASVTPSANKLYLLSVAGRKADGTDITDPTITGFGLTWDKIAGNPYDRTSTSRKSQELYWALGASPSTGAITINYGSQTITVCAWSIEEVDGMDTVSPIVQSATAFHQDTEGFSSITVTLAAFSDAANATFGSMVADGNPVATVSSLGTGFTGLANPAATGDGVIIQTQYRTDNDTTVDITWSKVVDLGGIAIEIKAAGGVASTTRYQHLTLLGVG